MKHKKLIGILATSALLLEIGRASGRDRVCGYV